MDEGGEFDPLEAAGKGCAIAACCGLVFWAVIGLVVWWLA